MKRKERKYWRKRKHLTNATKIKADKALSDLAWQISKELVKKEVIKPNIKIKCDKCQEYSCIGFDGIEVKCKTCHFKNCCIKLSIEGICQKCNKS